MLLSFGEGDEFCLNGRAVSGSDALYLSIVERRVWQSFHEHLMYLRVGVAYPAGELLERFGLIEKAELVEVMFPILHLHVLEVYGSPVDAYRCAGFHTCCVDTMSCDALCEVRHSRFGYSSSRNLLSADV